MTQPHRAPQPTPDDKPAPAPNSDQEIDTAGTEADEKGRPEEVPGDENSHDIVGPTGEEMPNQTHAGVQSPKRRKTH